MKHDILISAVKSKETIMSRLMNPTLIPDEILDIFTPIIFIQHPAIVFPAWLRLAKAEYGSYTVDEDDFTVWTSHRWSRMIFDYLRHSQHTKRMDSSQSAKSFNPQIVATRPYVIDAADVANNTHATLATICRLLGVKFEDVYQGWAPLNLVNRAGSAIKKALPETLVKAFTDRVTSTNPGSVSLEVETEKWAREFSEEAAAWLRRKVEEDMPHYEYLRHFRLRVRPTLTPTSFLQSATGMPDRSNSAVPSPTEESFGEKNFGHPLRMIRSSIDVHRGD